MNSQMGQTLILYVIYLLVPCMKDHHVFSFESDALGDIGRRRFLATTYLAFFEKYRYSMTKCPIKTIQIFNIFCCSTARSTPAEERHFYEIIPEGHACKLYFDIEFNKELNPDCNGVHLIDMLIEVCWLSWSLIVGLFLDSSCLCRLLAVSCCVCFICKDAQGRMSLTWIPGFSMALY